MSQIREVQLVKLGGSLITDKQQARTPRHEVIETLALELGTASTETGLPLIVGHGSGSFGHVEAKASGIHQGVSRPEQLPGVGLTQGRALELHQIVMNALRKAGRPAYSVVPSSCMVARGGRPEQVWPDPLLAALGLGLLPVVFGDVLMDRDWGASISSTEAVFLALVPALASRGVFVRRVVWLGRTDGILAADGTTIAEIPLAGVEATLETLEGAAGTDVTGGMRHRLETAVALAKLGVGSWIGDGRRPGALIDGLTDRAEHGTRVLPGG